MSLIVTFFLSIFFFIPFVSVTLEASKGFLISIGVVLSALFWLVARLFDGKFSIPKDKIILCALLIPVIFLIASFFSSSSYISLFGSGFEIGTFGSMMILFFLFFLSSIYFQEEKRLWNFYYALFGGAIILAFFELIHIFVGFQNIFGIFKGVSSGNLLGSWNDFALFFGLIVIISLFTLEFLKLQKLHKWILYILLVISLLFLILVNTPLIWLLVGLFSLIVFVYSVSLQHNRGNTGDGNALENKLSLAPLIVVIVSLLFLIGGNFLGSFFSKYVNIYNPDVRPSISATYHVAVKAIRHNPFFGTGPNTFNLDWTQWKPTQIVQTIFWNTDFNTGIGLVPTFLITTGILGFLAWLLFLFMFAKRGFQSMRLAFQQNPTSNYFVMTSFVISLYSWITLIVYTPNIVMLIIAFMSTGVFIGILASKSEKGNYNFSFLNDPRNSFFSILALVVLIIIAVSTTYVFVEKFASVVYFSNSLNPQSNIQSLTRSESMLNNAISLDKNDIYYRTLSQVYIAEISALLSDKTLSQDTLKSSLQTLVNSVQQAATSAVTQNPKQYLNWVNLGDIYSTLTSLGVAGSYDNGVKAYDKAIALAPMNPSILLSKAQLELNNKNNDGATGFINQALALKPNYTDAIFMLAQIQVNAGNLPEAINQAEKAALITPNDPTVFFKLGILRYNNNSFADAVSAFEMAVRLNPSYMNARYFLGMSYQKVGRTSDAIGQFKILNQALPDNKDVKANLDSLVAGNGLISTGTTTTTPSPTATVDTTKPNTIKPNTKTKLPLPEKQ